MLIDGDEHDSRLVTEDLAHMRQRVQQNCRDIWALCHDAECNRFIGTVCEGVRLADSLQHLA